MKKFLSKLLVVTLALVMSLGVFAGCFEQPDPGWKDPNPNPDPLPEVDAHGRPQGDFTYRSYVSQMPNTFNPHDMESSTESSLLGYMVSDWMTMSLDDPDSGESDWSWVPEMASKAPEDVTAQYAGDKGPYGIPAEATDGYAFKLTLRNGVVWDNGDPIVAGDFVESLKLMMDPAFAQENMGQYYQGSTLDLANAYEYSLFLDGVEEDKDGVKAIDDINKVGLKALNDNELLVVFVDWNSNFFVNSNWPAHLLLVHKETYLANKTAIGDDGYYKTTYNTSPATARSYGPYKLVSMQHDVEVVFEKNDKWFGWTDPAYDGQLWTNKIVYSIIKDSGTAMLEFKAGNIDSVGLSATTYPEFKDSSYLLVTPTSTTRLMYLNNDATKLAAVEQAANNTAVKNLKYLANDSFRQALYYAINREELASKATPGFKPATVLLDGWWEYNIDQFPGEKFRDTRQAMEALAQFYGIKNYSSMSDTNLSRELAKYASGYNKSKAVELFNKAVQEVDGGTAPDKIAFRMHTGDTDQSKLIVSTLNDIVRASAKGSKLEGKIEITHAVAGDNAMTEASTGVIECYYGLVSYPFIYPDSQLYLMATHAYADLAYGARSWFADNSLTIKINGEDQTKTYAEWGYGLAAGQYESDYDVKLLIMAQLEIAIVAKCFTIPVMTDTSFTLRSAKIEYALEDYHSLMGYGGMRYYEYKFTDQQWAAYVATGKLTYTK